MFAEMTQTGLARISYFGLPATTTCAALRKESRMQIIEATGLRRKSGGAEWRDLRFSGPCVEMFFYDSTTVANPTQPRLEPLHQ